MRILYLTGHYPPDFTSGATLQVQRLASAARRAGHDVLVVAGAHRSGLADGATRHETVDGIDIHWIGTGGVTDQDRDDNWWNPVAAAVVEHILDSWRPDVVHAHALQTLGADSLLAASARGIRTVVTMHDFWWVCARLFLVDRRLEPCALVPAVGGCDCARSAGWRRERERRLRDVLQTVDLVLTPSSRMRDVLAANGIRALVDPNDVEAVDVSPRHDRADHHEVRFLYIGGPNPLKGADLVRAAAIGLHDEPGWRLTAHGLDDTVAITHTTPRVVTAPPFEPAQRDAVLAGADVLLLPSIARESFSLAAREALRAGLAVVTSDCLGPEEVVDDGVNGLVVPTGDATALADAMRRLIRDHQLLRRLQRGAADTPIPALDADTHLAALIPHYAPASAAAAHDLVTSPRHATIVVDRTRPADMVDAERTAHLLGADGWHTTLADDTARSDGDDLAIVVGDATSGAPVVVRARPTPRVRIVLVNHRGRDLTLRCLDAIDALTYPRDRVEVVVVDNNSADGLVEHLRATRPAVRVIALADNRGFGAGCNAGISAPGDWDAIALVNNDSVPEPHWLDALVATWFRPPITDGPVGAVAGRVRLAGTNTLNSAGCDLRDGGFNADRGDGEADDAGFDESEEVFGWSGASALLTRAMLDDVGLFDESLFLYYEDVDMVWRGRRRGWSVAYAPAALSEHDRGATAGRGDLFAFHDLRNRLIVLARHAPRSWFARAVAVQLRAIAVGGDGPRRGVRARALVSVARRGVRLARERRQLARRATVDLERVVTWRRG